ncbi:MAG: hypothetical protein J0M30_12410 [Chitinophagales bacterium]|nr:hypothetical protein [Chitinophagales bacterium]
MWKEYYNLNKHKPLKPLIIIWATFLLFITILSQVLPARGDKVSISTGFLFGLIFSTFIVVFSITFAFLLGLYNFRRKRIRFNKKNLKSFFDQSNFKNSYIYQETKLRFTEEVKFGVINDIPVIADIIVGDSKFVRFQFLVDSEPIPKKRFKELTEEFKDHNAFFDIGYIFKKISRESSASKIETELKSFSIFLLSENFKPLEDK